MTTPSGEYTPPFRYFSTVSEADFDAATETLDRALLRVIGLPDSVDVRTFENAVFAIVNKVNTLIKDFTLSGAIWIIPEIIDDGIALWDKMEPVIKDQIQRTDFISRVIVYAYKKHDPDLPFLPEPFETMVEDLILGAVPKLVEEADTGLEPLILKWIEKLKKFFR